MKFHRKIVKNKAYKKIKLIYKRQPLMVFIFLVLIFILIRNWQVIGVADVYDGLYMKAQIIGVPFDFLSFKSYVHDFVFRSYNQHFIPIWFLLFYIISFISDGSTIVLGFISFAIAAVLLAIVTYIIISFVKKEKSNKLLAGILLALIFSGSVFFLEMLTWRWMLCIFISAASFYACILILLKEKSSNLWLFLYTILLACSIWTFGTGWVWAWGIVFFLLLIKRTNRFFVATTILATMGIIFAYVSTSSVVNEINVPFLLLNIPSAVSIFAVNIVLNTMGFEGLRSVGTLYVPAFIGVCTVAAFFIMFASKYRDNNFNTKDALVCTLALVYVATVALAIFRVMATGGQDAYIQNFGNRHIFTFAIILMPMIGLLSINFLANRKKNVLLTLIFVFVVIGFINQANYATYDPYINNRARTDFYNLTPVAVVYASKNAVKIPNIKSELLFKGHEMSLKESIGIRYKAQGYEAVFVPEESITLDQCKQLKKDLTIKPWLDSFSDDWCN